MCANAHNEEMTFFRAINITFKVLLVYCCIQKYVDASASPAPCWCKPLHARVHQTRAKLIGRYGLENLEEVSTFSTSGEGHALSTRLFESLDQKKPFRIGVLGGSFACPIYDGNNWAANVTRWMNYMLSASECRGSSGGSGSTSGTGTAGGPGPGAQSAVDASNMSLQSDACRPEVVPFDSKMACNNVSRWAALPALFCAPPTDLVQPSAPQAAISAQNDLLANQAHTMHPGGRAFDRVCDNSHLPQRVCSTYSGSGNYCTVIQGGKGGRMTQSILFELQTILDPNESLDLLLWDHGTNDKGRPVNLAALRNVFFDQLVEHFPSVAAVGMVYWPDTAEAWKIDGTGPTNDRWSTEMELLHLPLLEELFGRGGRFRNISLVTSSLNNFLNTGAYCAPDFIHPNSMHPTIRGSAMFADLFIWELVSYLNDVLWTHCPLDLTAPLRRNKLERTHHHHAHQFANMPTAKHHFVDRENFDKMNISAQLGPPATIVHVHAALVFHSPLTAPIPHVGQLAILCIKGGSGSGALVGNNDNRTFDPFRTQVGTQAPPRWVGLDIVTLSVARCGGWLHKGVRSPGRADDDFVYSATSTPQCPSGGGPFMEPSCGNGVFSGWKKGTYPHRMLGPLTLFPPGLQEPDIVVRVAANMSWEYVCFNNCAPDVHWQSSGSAGAGAGWLKTRLEPGTQPSSCHHWPDRPKDTAGAFREGLFLLSWPAERCMAWTFGGDGTFRGHVEAETLMFVTPRGRPLPA